MNAFPALHEIDAAEPGVTISRIGQQTVLIIDDDARIREMMKDILELHRYRVLTAKNGREGIELARIHMPDLIISDVIMPEVDGGSVLQAIRSHPQTNTIPFIFVTARAARQDQRAGMELGADDYLTKPFSPPELLNAVETLLNKQAAYAAKFETTLRLLRKNISYAVPHELRTPLMTILGYADLIQQDAGQTTPEDIASMAAEIGKAGQRLHRVSENYLALAQIELLESDPVERRSLRNHILRNSGKVIQTVADRLATRYERCDDMDIAVDSLAVRIAESNLVKILEELIDNAFKFSRPGQQVAIRSEVTPDTFTIWIRDFGRGMTADQVQQIGAYMQFERALHEQQGLGLGFIIAKRLIELHDGVLTIRSAPDKGTLLTIELSQRD